MVTGIPLLIIILVAVGFIVIATSRLSMHAFLALLLASVGVGIAVGMPLDEVVGAINTGFGNLMRHIALIVVMGSIIGVVLERSGGAMRIADLILGLLGKKQPALAMSLVGATVSIPVFCDSGFIILSGLNDALARRTGKQKATLALALASGLYTTHTLIPPTPGPIAAAGNLGAADHLGTIIGIGFLVSIPVVLVAWVFARRAGLRIDADMSTEEPHVDRELPSAMRSLAPILLPILLIALGTIARFTGWEQPVIRFLGNPTIALLIGMLAALLLLIPNCTDNTGHLIGRGIRLAGPILIITGAGGAFGGVLQATPIADFISQWLGSAQTSGMLFLVIAFLIAALLKTSQGSSTNALVITSSMLAPMMVPMGFDSPYEMALVVMAIGGGAMTLSHANDSYFWVVSQFSGIRARDAFKSYSVMTGLQGITVLILTLLLSLLA